MKMIYVSVNQRIRFEIEVTGGKQAFEVIAAIQAAGFEEEKCGKCGCPHIKFDVRGVDKGKYFELHCTDPNCGARLDIGQHKNDKTLFIKRKDANNNWLPDNGWYVYRGNDQEQTQQPQPRQQPPQRSQTQRPR